MSLAESTRPDWKTAAQRTITDACDLLAPDLPIIAARAPGRLDVMGGVADYSGGLVLEGTLAVGTLAAVQRRADRRVVVSSLSAERAGWQSRAEVDLDRLLRDGLSISFEEAHGILTAQPDTRWASYPIGCLYALIASGWLEPGNAGGVSILIDSDVPLGAGVSSSAAVEVATMRALTALFGIEMGGLELARLCQIVENRVVGAPCGIMDQVTCALGRNNALLKLLCRPHDLQGYTTLPGGWGLIGIDSGVKHSVGGGNYRRARTAAFMGLAIVQQLLRRDLGGYLCALTPTEWNEIRSDVPETLTGAEYVRLFGSVPDSLSSLEPETSYRVRASAEHPILEHAGVVAFDRLLQVGGDEAISQSGALMLDAHRSYSDRIDLGSTETDLLVELAMDVGPEGGIFGAKITGGGSGGTVAILGSVDRLEDAARIIAARYREKTGIVPAVLTGSSPGAMEAGVLAL